MLVLVPSVRTQFIVNDFVKSLIISWQKQFNQLPQKQSIGVLYSQWSLETGQSASCWCYNIGNVKAADAAGETINYCALEGVWEIINGSKTILPPSNPGAWFRAFSSLQEGCDFYLNFLHSTHFASAFPAVIAGDPTNFATLLKQQHYYTAPLQDYINGLNIYFNKFMAATTFETIISQLNTPATLTTTNASSNLVSNISTAIGKIFSILGK